MNTIAHISVTYFTKIFNNFHRGGRRGDPGEGGINSKGTKGKVCNDSQHQLSIFRVIHSFIQNDIDRYQR